MLINTMCNIIITINNKTITIISTIITDVKFEVSIPVCEESVLVVTPVPICQNRSEDQTR